MKVCVNWLREYVDIDMPTEELAHLLTMTGLEVEGIEAVGQSLDDIVVARIVRIDPHPRADRLSLCEVDTGQDRFQVVCGAPNLEEELLVPLALPGVSLPGGTTIKETQIRGERSKGMLLAEDEMGLTDDHTGIMILPPDLRLGSSLPSVLPLADWVLDVSITPNRPDCASVIGIAREIAAAAGQRLKCLEIETGQGGSPIEDLTSVSIVDPAGCPRYAAAIIQDVTLIPSPFWMRYRLYLSGIRSINNIVDVTNYVMLEMGQPMHAFDYNRLRENRIVVRRAQEGEAFTTLDGVTRELNSEILMICDGERPVAVAGIMGGLNSEIFTGTQHILLESAFFDPLTIRRGSKYLGLSTEASYRFERGADIEGVTKALKRAISLISGLAGGKIATGLVDNYPNAYRPVNIDIQVDKTNRILGTALSCDAMAGYLRALEMEVDVINESEMRVTPPSFRVDVTRDVDLIEEVARLDGFENIPVTYPRVSPSVVEESPELVLRDRIKAIMAGIGFTEIITYSFVPPDLPDLVGVNEESPLRSFVRLMNPLSTDQSVMRTSLMPGILATAKTNILSGGKGLKLFEWGKIFIRREDDQQPLEKTCLAGLMTGLYHEKTWYDVERRVDFYDIKGAVEALLESLGLRAFDLKGFSFKKENGLSGYDPHSSTGIYSAGSLIGTLGKVSSRVVDAYGLRDEDVYLFEIDIESLLDTLPETRKYRPFVRFPGVYRDISLTVNRQIESAQVIEIIRQEGGDLVEYVHIFDLYEGKNIASSEKALAFRVCYRSKKGTLDGIRVNRLHDAVIGKICRKTGGKLREG